jgi:hypothetical protein
MAVRALLASDFSRSSLFWGWEDGWLLVLVPALALALALVSASASGRAVGLHFSRSLSLVLLSLFQWEMLLGPSPQRIGAPWKAFRRCPTGTLLMRRRSSLCPGHPVGLSFLQRARKRLPALRRGSKTERVVRKPVLSGGRGEWAREGWNGSMWLLGLECPMVLIEGGLSILFCIS